MNKLLVALLACGCAAQSKATPKQNTEFKSKEGRQELEKDLQKKSTP